MKLIKRLGAIATAIAVMLTVGSVSAFADQQPPPQIGSLTIQGLDGNTKSTSTFVAYQLITFNASVAKGKTYFTDLNLNANNTDIYKSAIISAIPSAIPSLSQASTPNDIFNAIQSLNATQSEQFASALKTSLTGQTTVTPIQNTSGGIFSSLPYGYYLVVETSHDKADGSLISDPFLVCIPENGASTIVSDRTVKVKTSTANVEKKIVLNPGENESLVDSSTAAIGDTVEYQAISSIPTYSVSDTNITYSLTDTLSKGLDFNSIEKVSIIGGSSEKELDANDYTLTPNPPAKDSNSGETIFNVNLTNSDHIRQWGNAGYRLKIRYSAKLNDSAKYGETGNPNSIHLTYSVRDGSTKTTDDDTVITYTYKLVVTKTDNTDQHNKLAGATFQLQKKQGSTWKNIGAPQDTSSTQGDVFGTTAFTHLEQGDYQLVEVTAPAGYNLCDPIQFTVTAQNGNYGISDPKFRITEIGNKNTADNVKAAWDAKPKASGNFTFNMTKDELDVTIVDTPGFILPGTGGIGTTIFAVSGIGILLIGGCLALLYFRKKRSSER